MQHNNNTPSLRFPEFKGEWEKQLGSKLFEPISNKTHNSDLPILAISQEFGAVPRETINYQISVSEKSIDGYKVIEKGDFIISLRSFQGGIEYSNYKGICSPAYIILRSKVEINDHFYKIYFKSNNYIQALCSKLEGIRDGKMISYKYFSEIAIPEPTLAEQKRIASFFTVLDKKISQLKTKKEKLQQHKKGVMQQLFSQQLRFKDENGKAFANWEMKKLGEVGKFYAGGDLDKLDYSKIQDEKYCYPIYANGAGEGIYGYATTFQYNPNCVSVSGRGNLGYANVRIQKFNAIVRLIVIEPKEYINPKFLEEIINQTKFSIESTGVPQLTVPQISSYKISIPSLPEQTKIANFLSSIDEKINRTDTQIQQTQSWKKGLLQNMFV